MKKIKVSEVIDSSHSLMNDIVVGTANNLRDAEFIIKIDDLIKERGITQKDLAMMTGMRIGTISELVNGKGISFNKIQLLSLMVALRVTSFSDIFEIRLPEQQHSEYEQQSTEWKADKEIPIPVKEMFRDNVLKANKLLK
ncbi:helix-turn-helix transcriptional regulator [Priestia aryabhattai]|uniref:helix-turn-helix domain-containing protein n=1 Tax=Priestia aryabhattai TaxID=412384 RepID=UPI00203F6731|nr:helix-turn-helix transcriptional regulator [Priestia aryabhattai]MCM3639663.1 helix-turn-helix transcriptional regulator [Priestia aryabhattai]